MTSCFVHEVRSLLKSGRLCLDSETAENPPPTTTHHHTDYSVGAGVVKAKRFVYHAKPAPHPRNTPSEDNTPITPVIGFPQPFNPSDSHHLVPDVLELEKTRQCTAGDLPFLTWLSECNAFIKEFLWHEAAADNTAECPGCMEAVAGSYRCRQCFDKHLYCEECMVNQHQALPFHELEKWNSHFFECCSLQSLGLCLQLGHPIDRRCVRPMPSFGDVFTVITSHSLIPVSVDYCGCTTATSRDLQLLRYGLFPATTTDPRMAATFEVLRLFQILTFGSKVSGYEFYQALMRLTNNLGGPVPDRYSAFMRIVREWRHIRLMRRMGRGHESSGVSGTNEGECAVLCPACPQPEKNLPSSWKEANESQQWIYALFLAIDANFRLKRLSASNGAHDPSLNRGCMYFVEEAQYKDFLRERAYTNIDEANTCNNYDAVKLASIRGGKGTTASSVGTIECSRHDMKCPVSVGDLQRGEQYINMDYLYFSSIKNHSLSTLVVSYDITCQWSRNLLLRSMTYPLELVGTQATDLRLTFLIPKFHLYVHRTECQINYSFNLTPGVGCTDGESPERGWAAMNPVTSSTKEMGPGSRRDTLDNHFSDYNWWKVTSLHELKLIYMFSDISMYHDAALLSKMQEAVEMRAEHIGNFLGFSDSLPATIVQQFYRLVLQWESGSSEQNPYEAKVEAISVKRIRLELAQEEASAVERDKELLMHDTVSPSILITQGLELQDQQARLKIGNQAVSAHPTEIQRTHILEHRNRLMRQISSWQSIQELYIPGIGLHRHSAETRGSTNGTFDVEEINLFLLSNLVPRFHVDTKLAEYEWRLRYAIAHDLLSELRRQLLILGTMYQSKDRYVCGQEHNTCSITLIKNVQSRINYAATQY
ncbi:hypothetical protein BDN71DRAFT_1592386 [Pleurotus eryngii]|uniref:CxC2-like cysteine cluster KDZ transposase-associated domain-containing protein n=1 Tax=Pleurotus eryngii TaxID=5323 RepID=A0A9P5ZMZ5_PLEER|nr:hypothetical protein BDN71DRAFT_1592386 [Pleurotus eryngii]